MNAISATYHASYSTLTVTNVPLSNACAWAKVTLDGKSAIASSVDGFCEFGLHQPLTNKQLHFSVTPAGAMEDGVYPVNPVTATDYDYDDAGQVTRRITADGTNSYEYDAAKNMVRCYGADFTNEYWYDHQRKLIREIRDIRSSLSSNLFIYNGMDIVAKVDEVSGEFTWFTRGVGVAPGVGDVIAETRILGSSTQTCVYVQNHRGDTVALVGSSGLVVGRYEYDAWGNVTTQSGVNARFTFSGKHFDEEARLYYYGFRWYDPEARRWTQEDPFGNTTRPDLYNFVSCEPLAHLPFS